MARGGGGQNFKVGEFAPGALNFLRKKRNGAKNEGLYKAGQKAAA